MKIVFFSDVHGNQYAFEAFQKDMDYLKPDKVVFLGDVFGYYYGQEIILASLRTLGYDCLMGNHDKMFLNMLEGKENMEHLCERYGSSYRRNIGLISQENIHFLQGLSSNWECCCDGMKMAAFHGSPEDSLNGRVYPDTKIENESIYSAFNYVFLGHTHHKMIRKIAGAQVVNPGSIGQQRDGKGCSYCIFDTITGQLDTKTIQYPIQLLIDDIQKNDSKNTRLIEVLVRNSEM